MSINQANKSLQSQFNFSRSTFVRYSAAEDFVSLAKLIELCQKNSIQIVQLSDKRLQSGLNIIPFKVTSKTAHQNITIFLTKYTEKSINVTAYKNGKKIDSANASNQQEISKLIKKWVDSNKSHKQDYQQQSLKIIQKLDKKCQEIAKQQKNQMMAIQKFKSTSEYQALIELQIQLAMEIDSLSQQQIQKQQKIQQENPQLIDKLLLIQKLKNEIEENQYEYENVCKHLRNVKQMINQLMQKLQQKTQKFTINNQNELNDFLSQAKKLKKLQLQKRFLH